MPCRDYEGDTRVVYTTGVDPFYKSEVNRLKKRCDDLTKLLCAAGRARHNKTDIPPEVLNWWADHCKMDAKHGQPW